MLKLLAYAALGYLAYEFYLGLVHGPSVGRSRSRRRNMGFRDLERALNEGAGRMNVTGAGRGTTVWTEDSSGTSATHVVGRGVVRR
jgi:hypothetical protein